MSEVLAPGTMLAGYRVESLLGRGGMGCVYRATQVKLERAVALKVIAAPFADDDAFRERFRREALAAAAIDHPHVLPVFEADDSAGLLFLSMRLVEGHSLAEIIARDGPLEPELAVRLTTQIGTALDAAHAAGIVHRDVKPANVLIGGGPSGEHAYLMDFGIAKRAGQEALTNTGQLVGTLDYVAPEVLRGEVPDASADVYALGCLLFEALTGQPPYRRDSHEALIYAHLFEPVPSVRSAGVDVSPALDQVVQWAIAKQPEERPRSAGELGAAALDALAGRGGSPVAKSAADLPVTRLRGTVRTNLPAPTGRLIGRDRELRDLELILTDGDLRVVTVTGPGGTGKTRVALATAEALAERFQDGAFLVELAALNAVDRVPGHVAEQLGLREQPGVSWEDRLVGYLRDRKLLLVLDNCEHLLSACAELADRLARSCPALVILATSREPLRILGEQQYHVPSLGVPAPEATPDDIGHADAVRLFCERAGEQRSDFALNQDNARAVAAVCRRVDGMPLAIELAAARTRSLSVEEIAARLDQRFRLLTQGSRTASPRQQTLRATVDWSFDLLAEPERDTLCRLSVFMGDFDVDAAEAVCSSASLEGAEAFDVIASLVDKSLVQAAAGPGGGTRYRLLETIREFASEHLAARGDDARRAAQLAHLEHYLERARVIAPGLTGSAQAVWLDRLETEYANLRAALDLAADQDDPRPGLQLVAALGHYWERRGHLGQGAELIARAVHHPRVADAPTRERAVATLAGAYVAAMRGATPDQVVFAEHVLELTEGLDAPAQRCAALAHRSIGTVHFGGGAAAAARDAERALELAHQTGAQWLIARATQAHVHAAFAAGDLTACLAWQERALAGYRRAEDPWRVALVLTNGGDIKLATGDHEGARRDLEDALALNKQIGARHQRGSALHNLAMLDLTDGDHISARARAHEALALAEELGDDETRDGALLDLALASGARGDDDVAATLHGAVDSLRGQGPWQQNEQLLRDREIDRLTGALGEATFALARRKGAAMSLREVRALADNGRATSE